MGELPLQRIPCPFCGTVLENPMQGWWEHLDDNPVCAACYEPWREYVQQEAGEV